MSRCTALRLFLELAPSGQLSRWLLREERSGRAKAGQAGWGAARTLPPAALQARPTKQGQQQRSQQR